MQQLTFGAICGKAENSFVYDSPGQIVTSKRWSSLLRKLTLTGWASHHDHV